MSMETVSDPGSWLSFVGETLSLIRFIVCSVFRSVIGNLLFFIPKRHKDISGDVVLITGGGRGLGRHIAFELSKHNPKQVILWGRNVDHLEATTSALRKKKVSCHYMVCDVSDQKQVYAKAAEVTASYGRVTMLISNAGVVYGKTVLNSQPTEIQQTLATNTLGNIWLLKAFVPGMIARNRGHIVCINSTLGLMGIAGAADYCASKHALTSFYDSLRVELSSQGCGGIVITNIHPYLIDTDMFAGAAVRFPWLFPSLDQHYVARRTVEAILTDRPMIIMPRFMYLVMFFKSLLPVNAMWAIEQFNGVDKCMDDYHGRSQPGPPQSSPS